MLFVYTEVSYYVFVYTSNIDEGGTQANVYITFHGNDESEEHNLSNNSSHTSFAQNQ
jgi:hypothetical protein